MAMAEDDMIVLVVVDDDDKEKITERESFSESREVDDILETAQKHGQYITVKLEPLDDYPCDYLEDMTSETSNYQIDIKLEPDENTQDDNDEDYIPDPLELDNDYIPEDEEYVENENKGSRRQRITMLKPWQRHSFVADLRQEYEELRDDEELLINTLEQIMRTVKAPPPPRDYFIMNGAMLECVQCGFLMETIPAAARHYQEKHGERYLVCYACGVDFRSTTNLYKHEKRCIAPDAHLVLKARAAYLGRKGRSRPYLTSNKFKNKRTKFPCRLCSAVFITKSNLESHENLHRGERPYRCHACPCAYTSHSALSRHTKKHTDIQFICDHCNRSFKIKAALVAHMDTHKPMRKHGCTECRRRFAQKSALKLHINRDHRKLPPPCACQICPKRYPRMSLLKSHMKRAHGMSIITRKMFFKSLPTMTELEVKESKVVLKYNEDDILDNSHPKRIKLVTEEYDQKNEELQEGNIENNEMNNTGEDEETYDIAVTDLLQYVRKAGDDLGSNVIYIQNGEIIQTNTDNTENKIVLNLEALVDDQILIQAQADENEGTCSRPAERCGVLENATLERTHTEKALHIMTLRAHKRMKAGKE